MSGHKNNSPGYFSILGLPHIGHTYYFPNLESTLLDYFIKRLTRLCWDSVLRQMFDYNFHQACLLSRSPLFQIFISSFVHNFNLNFHDILYYDAGLPPPESMHHIHQAFLDNLLHYISQTMLGIPRLSSSLQNATTWLADRLYQLDRSATINHNQSSSSLILP